MKEEPQSFDYGNEQKEPATSFGAAPIVPTKAPVVGFGGTSSAAQSTSPSQDFGSLGAPAKRALDFDEETKESIASAKNTGSDVPLPTPKKAVEEKLVR